MSPKENDGARFQRGVDALYELDETRAEEVTESASC